MGTNAQVTSLRQQVQAARGEAAQARRELVVAHEQLHHAHQEIDRLEAALAQEQREHANCEEFHHQGWQAQTTVMIALAEQNAAMRKIVAAVAEAGVGDEYGGGSWLMFAGYDAETLREQAQAFMEAHPAQESEGA